MPKRTDIKSILMIGAGPIVIGQACEFDYSGTQACKALKEEGYRVILINSNPATIMTDPELADATYIEPITPDMVTRIIEIEKPDALLPTMGGQTALNTAIALAELGVLEKHNVQLIGADLEAINKAEDRLLFREAMEKIGLESPRSKVVKSVEEALKNIEFVGLPTIIRPSFTMGGTGGGVAYNREEFVQIVEQGLEASPVTEVLIEESIIGWKEYEMEVVRDRADNCIIICSIENVDPMGVHTGDSITVAPALTLTDREYQIMRNASIAVLREIGVETGGSNVQFAVNPVDGRLIIIEMNPRVSRSSALASKATGFPIAKVAAKLAVGYTLDELRNDITGVTPASFEPTIDYVVTKIPRFAFEKFPGSEPVLTTAMKSVGESMAIGRCFEESLQKALRSLETGLTGLNERLIDATTDQLHAALKTPTPDRLLHIADALRAGMSEEEICTLSGFNPWFVARLKNIIDMEAKIREFGLPDDIDNFRAIKKLGLSDRRLAELIGKSESDVRQARQALGLRPNFRRIDTCAAEFAAQTPYLYSSYETISPFGNQNEAEPSSREKAVILGGGPNRIGQGIEFDYCCCHAAYAMGDIEIESIMVNCNPETVSTDYDTSDRLYFEPLTEEDVLEILHCEQSQGELAGVIVQFGGQTPLKLSQALEENNIPILGTSPDAIDLAEDRDRFKDLLDRLSLKQPPNGIARSATQAYEIVQQIGFPVVIRPSYVLGGRAMEIVHTEEQLERYMREAVVVSGDSPVLIDGYLRDASEVDVDVLCDGGDVYVAGILEHIEEAGVHSGDSACSMPPHSLPAEIIQELGRQATEMALALNVIGLMNVQFAVKDNVIYVIEVNPRASRTVPFVAKVLGQPIARIAAKIMAGKKLSDFSLAAPNFEHIAVKEAVFPFGRFPGVDTILGPEMRSTGEVMGLDTNFATAFAKSQIGGGTVLPVEGTAFISVRNDDKNKIVSLAAELLELGFKILATSGTCKLLEENGLSVTQVNKVLEGRPHIVDAMKDATVELVINTTEGEQSLADSKSIRRTALEMKIPYFTTIAAAEAAISGIKAVRAGPLNVRSLQDYTANIT
ncbi:Zinc import ATP-binding protein ZnuC [Candidatus Micropelagos thuwalensis]|uniref:Carbamoyl phosphate synthase large chain n=1 Tax=Candidatus Micropelagius thuwalensis TaxID=1397666 RepID=U2WDN0_9PROT|nr:carbamoyl-phosphate synthase large subunit [Candidatus Micropelagos thuwalensis]ERL47639.1 Zinc import ATP-binding protein ZnuC [Candidatus Micropelagos thuwalensis]